MIAAYIWKFGSLIFLVLGTIHLVYTFFTNKFSPKNEKVIAEMKISNPILTNETTIWKAWIGFNASHSIGAIFIGMINIYLAQYHFEVFGPFLFSLHIITVAFYLWLAKRYWFRIPFLGIFLTFICYIVAFVLIL